MDQHFKEAVPILKNIEKAGFEAYFVGGAVRDFLLNRPIADIDIATSAFPEEVKAIFPVTFDTGIKHGTITARVNDAFYEITTFRTEGKYADFRRPSEVTFIRSLREDLLRRDFTMNAIAMDACYQLHDPFSGQSDIQQHMIRAVGDPHERFREDALRMLRAVRFLSQLDFEIEKETKKALAAEIDLLRHTSIERVRVEWLKILQGQAVKKALLLVCELGIEKYLPGLAGKSKSLYSLAEKGHFNSEYSEEAWWLIQIIEAEIEDVRTFLKGWKLSNHIIRNVTCAYSFYNLSEWSDYQLYLAGPHIYSVVAEVKALLEGKNERADLDIRYQQLPLKNRKEMMLTGHDLMELENRTGGVWVKNILEQTEKAIIERRVKNDKNELKRWLGYDKE